MASKYIGFALVVKLIRALGKKKASEFLTTSRLFGHDP
jgi:hypothetical protein